MRLRRAIRTFLSSAVIARCFRPWSHAGRNEAQTPPGSTCRARTIRVRTAPAKSQNVIYQVTALGSLEAAEVVQVTAEVEGAVTEIRFHEGDRVSQETVLVLIDPERYRLEASRAEAAHAKAQAELKLAGEEAKRRERLSAEQLVPVEVTRYRGVEGSSPGHTAKTPGT
jgi:multidrug efflux system membrane fusion protein